jgi:glutamate synthase (NADPH/NADH) small chain
MSGSILRPFKALKFLGAKPVTEPLEPRPAAANYRGFHLNDWETCIGCGTCAKICDNLAIRMVHVPGLPEDPVQGRRAERPSIDYGRCCWCALCVDVCPTGSLALSREYVHVSDDPHSFLILPDAEGMHHVPFEKGWDKSLDADLLDLNRRPMPELVPEQRADSFVEMVEGFDGQTALLEASRCIQCGMCHDACPTHMHAPEYIRAIWNRDEEEAVRQILRTNPFGHVCGRVCTHRCEDACSIGVRGEPIAIRWLKRYAMDAVSHERVRQIAREGMAASPSDRRVAVIGAGPAGLTVAHDLAVRGHAVTVFEAQERPGGMMRYGIPEYRLPYARLDDDVDVILSLGVELRTGVRIGREVDMAELERDYDAVLVAAGLWKGRSTRIPGTGHEKVVSAIDLLRWVTTGEGFEVPRRAVVIGGGNVAMDAARTLARLQKGEHGAMDVTVTTLETVEEMRADPDEIREALEEGVKIIPNRGPRMCTIEADCLTGLETVRCISTTDDEGRFHPLYDESDVQVYGADLVVEAIGQLADLSLLGEGLTERLAWVHGRLKVDAAGRTSEAWLWAAGDMVQGPDVVHAVAAGHRVAESIHEYLTTPAEVSA